MSLDPLLRMIPKPSHQMRQVKQDGYIQKTVDVKKFVPERFHNYIHIFEKKASERFPERKKWDHAIDLKEGYIPRKGKPYALSSSEDIALRDFIDENLRKGYIRPSKSPQAVPMFFVHESDKMRPCQDYRYLNEWTVKNAYPLPLIDEMLNKLKNAKLFTQLDLRWGYNNIRIKEGDKWKAAFTTNRGMCYVPLHILPIFYLISYHSYLLSFYI